MYLYGPDHCLVVSLDLPVMGQVIEATPTAPYLCVRLDLDPGELGTLMMEVGLNVSGKQQPSRALFLSPVNARLLDATIPRVRLLETPQDITVLAPLIVREILYRLLFGEVGCRI